MTRLRLSVHVTPTAMLLMLKMARNEGDLSFQSSPVVSVADSTLFVGSSEGSIYASDSATENARWTREGKKYALISSSPPPMIMVYGTSSVVLFDHFRPLQRLDRHFYVVIRTTWKSKTFADVLYLLESLREGETSIFAFDRSRLLTKRVAKELLVPG